MSPRRFARRPSTWLGPVAVVILLGLSLPLIYLGGTLDPQGSLRDLPVAVVVEPQTVTVPGDDPAEQVAAAISAHVDHAKIALVRLTPDEERREFATGGIDGAVRIPADFSARTLALLSTQPDAPPSRPLIHLDTTARSGAMTTGLFTGNVAPVLDAVRAGFGQKLTERAGPHLTAAAATALAAPFAVQTAQFDPLPSHTGLGTSVFYLAIVLVLIAFIGASAIHPLIDSASGFIPQESGPKVSRRPYLHLSRTRTLLIKWVTLLVAAPVAAASVLAVAGPLLGMPIDDPVRLWLFCTATIAVIGLGGLTVFAVFGSFGPLVNTFFFVALAMTSSGGAVPLEATPSFFRAIAPYEPMSAIVGGLRSILYFDSAPGSGHVHAWLYLAALGAAGCALGALATRLFDGVPSFSRHPDAAVLAGRAA